MDIARVSTDERAVAQALESVIAYLRASRQSLGISASALSVLSRLDAVGAVRITDLAEFEGLSQPGMTTLVNRLVESGYAQRNPDPADGRVVRVTITPSGVERLVEYREERADLIASRLRQLTSDDYRALVDAIPALSHFIAE